ncbi:MAG: hypothetical protein ACJAS4_003398 [Bacteriovoracaceae bacterium]|jgi:hypothetical protein
MLKKLISTGAMIATVTGFACTIDGSEGLLPENNMWISTTNKSANTMTEERFNAVIDKVVKVYEPIITANNATLKIARNWDDGTVNAYASRSGSTWNVAMFGGLARHAAITEDGFALVVCHELGHHIGGAPKKGGWFGSAWATNEGQADYFATLKCLRKSFRGENNAEIVKSLNVPAEVTTKCSETFSDMAEQLICERGAMAGLSTAKLFQDLRSQTTAPEFTTPDAEVVSKTNHNHPDTQCRLDTYFAGAICNINDTVDVDQEDEAVGVCYRASGDSVGVRPLCWFKPE